MRDPTLNLPSSQLPLEPESQDFRASMHWRVFRIMAELLEGWQFLADFPNNVAVFGSATLPENNTWYNEARTLGQLLADAGFTVITGGGPGILQATNQGAHEATAPNKGDSVGFNIKLSHFIRTNPYVDKHVAFHYFFVRDLMISYSARAYIYFPGGLGTLHHLTSILTLLQTKKIVSVPIILIGTEFWQPLLTWINDNVYEQFKTIDKEDTELYHLVDSAQTALELVKQAPERTEL